MTEWTRETPAEGLVVYQPKPGFRYSADAFWLAGFALDGPDAATAVDLGTGSGIVAFLLARAGLSVRGLDSREEWTEAWRLSLAESRTSVDFLIHDAGTYDGPRADLVVCNPPYFPDSSGPRSPNPWKAAARTESTAVLRDFVDAAARLVTPEGRVCFIVPRSRESEVRGELHARRIYRVGTQRSLVELTFTPGPCERLTFPDRGEQADRLYRMATQAR